VVVERGVASAWGLAVGDVLSAGRADLRVVGIAVSPDNVAFPLASAPRVYVRRRALGPDFAGAPTTNLAMVWVNDPDRLDVTLTQARAVSFGLTDLRVLTRQGVRTLINQAAGIVISLLIAFSLVALASAGTMLAASSHAEVQRRLPTIGVLRALGFSPRAIAGQHALDAGVLALPAGALGLGLGTLVAAGPSARLLESVNELAPGMALAGPLALALAGVLALVTAAAAWPAWRAARRPPVAILRGGDGLATGRARGARALPAGFLGLGMRLATARRGRAAATVSVLALSGAVVMLMLGLASLLERLRDDPATVGKRYSLTADYPSPDTAPLERVAGVAGAAPRYEVEGADSFRLGESLRVVAFPGDHTAFEAPPLAEGRRLDGAGEAEVGAGLADALGLRPGGMLAVQIGAGEEVRFRVAGVVRALENDGRMVYARPDRLLAADPSLPFRIAVRLDAGARPGAVVEGLEAAGATVRREGGSTTDNREFLSVLAALLRAVAVVNAAVCLYILVQVLSLTARERRSTIAVLRASGAGRRQVALVLAGAAALLVALAAPVAIVLERLVLAPGVSRLAAAYVSLPLATGAAETAAVVGGLLLLALAAAGWTAGRLEREPIVAGLRGE
jgi:ABC-type antimicrobial peptide transport system permease subunit